MRTLIRFFWGLLGYHVFFVQRKQNNCAIHLNKLEKANNDWGKKNIIKNFNKQTSSSFSQQMCTIIQNAMENKTIHTICDVGCGNGNLLAAVSKKFNITNAIGFDFSEQAIKVAQSQHPTFSFDVHDIYVPMETEKFDVILCTEVLEHLEHPEIALKNIIDSLSHHGMAFITVPNGRLDFFEGHINFWSIESFGIFLKKFNSCATVQFFSNNNMRLLGIIKK